MPDSGRNARGAVPLRALLISLGALLVPVGVELAFPREALGDHQALLWLVALIPAFLLAYYRGWRGAATALAAGMSILSLTQAVALWAGRPLPDLLVGVVVAYLAITLGIGWLAECLHTDREVAEDLAFTDILTRLPNRRHARVFLENEFAAAERGRLLSAVLFDLDNFKLYNDRFGHTAGDRALEAFADILARTTRRMNLSARFGGEEFLTVLAGSDVEGALVFAERVRVALRATTLPQGSLTVSAGVAVHHPSMRSPDELLAAADRALYQAKRDGRNCVRLFGRALLEESAAEVRFGGDPEPREWGEGDDYPRRAEELGQTRPPLTLLPHQVTGFGATRKALLVEDEDAVRGLLATYLRKEGFALQEAPDVPAAVRHLGSDFDVVITDLRLPGPGGAELVRAVKARWPATQVVAITGIPDPQVAAEALSAGADRLLRKPFGMQELRGELLEALARRDHLLMERNRRRFLSAEARERSNMVRDSVLRGTRALVEAVEQRDPYLQGHHRRVVRYAGEIARALDPEGVELPLDSLLLGASLLDLGKMEVPDSVLNREGPLTLEERELLQRHPETGRRILEPLIQDEVALQVVTWHHERWDGSGYPTGLLGEATPLPARLAGVADVLAAMTWPRAHREPFPFEEAVKEIVARSGTLFDPRVVEALRRALPSLREAHEEETRPGEGSEPL